MDELRDSLKFWAGFYSILPPKVRRVDDTLSTFYVHGFVIHNNIPQIWSCRHGKNPSLWTEGTLQDVVVYIISHIVSNKGESEHG